MGLALGDVAGKGSGDGKTVGGIECWVALGTFAENTWDFSSGAPGRTPSDT